MTEPRVTRSKARSLNLGDENSNNKLVVNKNKQNKTFKTVSVESENTKMNPAPMKLKNTFNNFSNTKNISETTNYTVSVREATGETENSENSETKNCQQQVLESVDKMVMSGKTDMKVVRCFIEHVSGGDVVGLLAKLVTSTELDKIVDIVGATEVKQEALNDNNVEVSDSQDNDETVEHVISDDERNEIVQNRIDLDEENSDHGNDLPVISEVVGSHFDHSDRGLFMLFFPEIDPRRNIPFISDGRKMVRRK